MDHTSCSVDIADLLRLWTHKPDSTSKSRAHGSPPGQSTKNSFFLTVRPFLLLSSSVNFENLFSADTQLSQVTI